jgi:FHS family L-fucose permease-like MFS transporter
MAEKKYPLSKIIPVMFGFFIMGFSDIIGVTTNYVKHDMTGLTDTTVNMVSLSCFLWFLILSIPTGMLMNRIGRKNTVLVSFVFQALAMCLPIISYNFVSILIAFSLLGIGNTILQVSMNPLVSEVVSSEKLTGSLTLGQFLKAIFSFCCPLIAAWGAGSAFGWKVMFPIYAVLSALAFLWLVLTPIQETKEKSKEVSFGVTFQLLKDKYIVALFIGILVLVGVDVSINMTFPKFLIERCGLDVAQAGMGNSVYFFSRTVGAFVGGILLLKYSSRKFFIGSVFVALCGLLAMCFASGTVFILITVAVFGVGYANLFSIIFGIALHKVPEKSNEVSALLVSGICGGAILPPIIGMITDHTHTQLSAIITLIVVWCYMLWLIKYIQSE